MGNIRQRGDEVTPGALADGFQDEALPFQRLKAQPITPARSRYDEQQKYSVPEPHHPEPYHQEFLGMKAVVASPAMRRLITAASRIARTNSPVLVTGESGTGKEIVARAVHHYSTRAARPFIDVNCAALPEHLMESEL